MNNKKIGEILKSKRIQLGLTPEEMARRTNCNRTTVERMEKGGSAIRRTKLALIAQAYEMPTEELAELCGYNSESLQQISSPKVSLEIWADESDLEFILNIARGLRAPMKMSTINDLLRCRHPQ